MEGSLYVDGERLRHRRERAELLKDPERERLLVLGCLGDGEHGRRRNAGGDER